MIIIKVKKIILLLCFLLLLQLGRILFKNIIFLLIPRTLLLDIIVNIVYMIIIIGIILIIINQKRIKVDFFPKKFNIYYKIITILTLLLLILTPIITKNYSLFNILSLFYNAIITVIFEELLFRGLVFKEVESITNAFASLLITSILFGIWHLGYIDTIIWRTSIFNPSANIPIIMFWKVITGLIIGLVLGFFRYKNKNVYSSSLVHLIINIIGS